MTPEEKHTVKREIVEAIERVCTGDAATCIFGFCVFNKACARPHFEVEKLPASPHRLKKIRKNVGAHLNENTGSAGVELKKKCFEMLGQDILQHELIKGHGKSIRRVNSATRIEQILEVLDNRHFAVHGKRKLFGNRRLYGRYKNENKNKKR